MKRIAAFLLLAALSVACSMPVQAQNTTTDENMHRARQGAKRQQKVSKKLTKKQRKAMKKSAKAQRKAAKQSQRHAQY
jgi:Spy/CpxP family protein refolding chaperone